jgi:hypothetical protein
VPASEPTDLGRSLTRVLVLVLVRWAGRRCTVPGFFPARGPHVARLRRHMPASLALRIAGAAAAVAALFVLPASAGAVDFVRSLDVDTAPAPSAVAIARPFGRHPATVIIPSGTAAAFWTFHFGSAGPLANQAKYSQVPGPSSAVVAAGFDADDVDDLAIANSDGEGVSIDLYLTGIGFFFPQIDANGRAQTFPTGARPVAIAAAPFDLGTKRADLATANAGDDSVTTWRSEGRGKLHDRADVEVGKDPRAVAIGRFAASDFDFRLDIAVAVAGEDRIAFLQRQGPHLPKIASAKAGNAPTALAAADYNRDGIDDLAIGHAGGDVSLLFGTRGNSFAAARPVLNGRRGGAIATADFDRDGNPDLAVTDPTSKAVAVLLGHGDGSFGNPRRYGTGARPEGVAARDVNGDGRPDIVTANTGDSTATTLINQG